MISIVVIMYNMHREIRRTLRTMSHTYQNFPYQDYEIIIVDNGSDEKLVLEDIELGDTQLYYHYLEDTSASPAQAINFGLQKCRGAIVGLMVDGARMMSPGVLNYANKVFQSYDNPVVTTLGFHLGFEKQQLASAKGYNQSVEDELLTKCDWEQDGYALFDVSCFAGSSSGGWFTHMAESNCFFAKREVFQKVGGAEERFILAGGGFVNLDLYKRMVELEAVQNVRLLGEGTFHQYHGGASTTDKAEFSIKELRAEYVAIRGGEFTAPEVSFELVGHLPGSLHRSLLFSADTWSKNQVKNNVGDLDSKGVIILGMHRSGTSALTGILEEAGLYLGEVINQSPFNKKGNKENKLLWEINDAVLEIAGGRWDKPVKKPEWRYEQKIKRDEYLQRFRYVKLWGFKDPRLVLTLDGWLPAISNYELVGIFRHPFFVAQSLKKRGNMPFEEGLQLWLEYNWRIKYFVQQKGMKLIEFATETTAFMDQAKALISHLGLNNQKDQYSFFENEMRHVELPVMEGVPRPMLRKTLTLYAELQRLVFCKDI